MRTILQSLLASVGFSLYLSGCVVEVDHPEHLTYARINGQKLDMHIELPANPQGLYPALVYLHGGNWYSGNMHSQAGSYEQMKAQASRGYVVVSADYRLVNPLDISLNQAPAQIQDIKCALRWLRKHAATYHIDPNAIAVWGHSAGGHLALLLGESAEVDDFTTTYPHDTCPTRYSDEAQAIIALSPVADTTHWWDSLNEGARLSLTGLIGDTDPLTPNLQMMTATDYADLNTTEKDRLAAINPLAHIDSNGPPVLIIHNPDDTVVPVSGSQSFIETLTQLGRAAHLKSDLIGGHEYGNGSLNAAITASFVWFDHYLKGRSQGDCSPQPTCAIDPQ